jgi:hypothetical protein
LTPSASSGSEGSDIKILMMEPQQALKHDRSEPHDTAEKMTEFRHHKSFKTGVTYRYHCTLKGLFIISRTLVQWKRINTKSEQALYYKV